MTFKNFFSKNKKIVLAGIVFLLSLFFYSNSALAQTTYNALVTIPGIPPGAKVQVYLSGLYTFLISVVGIVAMGAIVIGGARYLTSAGNPSAIEDAKHTINSAIYGLLLAITSWVIINTINPDILVLKNPAMPWSAVGYNPVGSDPLVRCNPGGIGNGTTAPCACADGNNDVLANTTKTPTVVTLTAPIAGGTAAVSTTVALAGKLTDSSGTAISGKTVTVYTIFGSKMSGGSNPLTNGTGDYSINSTDPTVCAATVMLQAYFEGDDTYAPSVSAINTFTVTGVPACTVADFPLTLMDFTGTGCKNICSNPLLALDGKYHCMKADLRLGKMVNPPSGSKNIEVKVNERIYFDARSGSVNFAWPALKINVPVTDSTFENGIDSYLLKYNGYGAPSTWIDDPTDPSNIFGAWAGIDFSQYETGVCNILGPLGAWVGNFLGVKAGMGYFSYSAVGEYKVVLNVRSKNGCLGPAVDIGHIVVK